MRSGKKKTCRNQKDFPERDILTQKKRVGTRGELVHSLLLADPAEDAKTPGRVMGKWVWLSRKNGSSEMQRPNVR